MRASQAWSIGALWGLGYALVHSGAAHAGGVQQPEVQLEATTVSGSAATAAATGEAANQGYVPRAQLENRPLLRPGELLETVPGRSEERRVGKECRL